MRSDSHIGSNAVTNGPQVGRNGPHVGRTGFVNGPSRYLCEMRRSFDRPLIILGFAFLGQCCVSTVAAANNAVMGESWLDGFATDLLAGAPWIPLTVAIFWLCRREPLRRPHRMRALAVHIAAAAIVIAVRGGYIYLLDPAMHWYPEAPPLGLVLVHSVRNNLFQYFMLVGVAHAIQLGGEAIDRARVTAELEVALARAEQAALAATLHPHFLFNTLQAVAEMVHRDVDAADRMLVQLGALLRRLLDDRRPLVPLRDELSFVADYLALEQVRFGSMLTIHWNIAEDLEAAEVPRLVLQPLAENAIRHGLWPTGRPGNLAITAHHRGDALAISICDDGIGLGSATTAGTGHGLASVRARLAHLYAGRATCAIGAGAVGGTQVRLELPLRPACAS